MRDLSGERPVRATHGSIGSSRSEARTRRRGADRARVGSAGPGYGFGGRALRRGGCARFAYARRQDAGGDEDRRQSTSEKEDSYRRKAKSAGWRASLCLQLRRPSNPPRRILGGREFRPDSFERVDNAIMTVAPTLGRCTKFSTEANNFATQVHSRRRVRTPKDFQRRKQDVVKDAAALMKSASAELLLQRWCRSRWMVKSG